MARKLQWMPKELYDSLHPEEQRFYDVAHENTEYWMGHWPDLSTWAGVHHRDHLLYPTNQPQIDEGWKVDIGTLEKMKRMDTSNFSEDGLIDFENLYSEINVSRHLSRRSRRQDPSEIIFDICWAIDVHRIQLGDRMMLRGAAILERVKMIPKILYMEKRYIDSPVIYWVDLAIESTAGAIEYFRDMWPTFENSKYKHSFRRIRKQTFRAFELYLKWLYRQRDKAHKHFEIGEALLAEIIQYIHFINSTPEGVARLGIRYVREIKEKLDKAAKPLGRNWRDILDSARKNHTYRASEMIGVYDDAVARLIKFIKANNIVSIPEESGVQVITTPPYERMLFPSAAYISPGPFSSSKGTYYVTLPRADDEPKVQHECLEGHMGVDLTSAHEGYPGHHLQLAVANNHPRKMRVMTGGTPYLVEGWGLYCEELMVETGFIQDPILKILMLADELWRALRIVIDVRMQQGRMRPEEAVQLLIDEVGFDRRRAQGEINWYMQSPGYPLCYLLGKKKILEMRENALNKGMTLRKFHDKLLAFGSVSPSMIEHHFV